MDGQTHEQTHRQTDSKTNVNYIIIQLDEQMEKSCVN